MRWVEGYIFLGIPGAGAEGVGNGWESHGDDCDLQVGDENTGAEVSYESCNLEHRHVAKLRLLNS